MGRRKRRGRLELSKFISTDNGQVMLRMVIQVNEGRGGLAVLFKKLYWIRYSPIV